MSITRSGENKCLEPSMWERNMAPSSVILRWKDVPLPGKNTVAVCHDIRAYYLEAALELVGDLAPGGRAFDAWFYEVTEAGQTILAARRALKAQEAPFPFWFYMVAGHLE